MKIPAAVYTAREGYGWVSGTGHGRIGLDTLRQAIGKTPELEDGQTECGALTCQEQVVVYRFMREHKADFRGRDAIYLAMCWFPKATAAQVNIACLLDTPFFCETFREPPSDITYTGPASAAAPPMDMAPSGTFWSAAPAGLNWESAGACFAMSSSGGLCLRQTSGGTIRVFYESPALEKPPAVAPSTAPAKPALLRPRTRIICVAVWAVIIGGLLGLLFAWYMVWLLPSKTSGFVGIECPIPEPEPDPAPDNLSESPVDMETEEATELEDRTNE